MTTLPRYGTAYVERQADGTRTVRHADFRIGLMGELVDQFQADGAIDSDGTLTLDTAGQYRYRSIAYEPQSDIHVYERT